MREPPTVVGPAPVYTPDPTLDEMTALQALQRENARLREELNALRGTRAETWPANPVRTPTLLRDARRGPVAIEQWPSMVPRGWGYA